jgi:putative transposase
MRKFVTGQLRNYQAAKAEMPKLTKGQTCLCQASAWISNRAENSHQPMRERERRMRGFREPERTQVSLRRAQPKSVRLQGKSGLPGHRSPTP